MSVLFHKTGAFVAFVTPSENLQETESLRRGLEEKQELE